MAYTPTDYTSLYNAILKAEQDAQNAQYQAQVGTLNAQLPVIDQTYDALRNKTYTNARLSALGNNETIAAKGLGGNAYTAPTSGYSETSRVAQDTSLRNALNAASLQQEKAKADVGTSITQAGLSNDQALASLAATTEQNKLSAVQSENQYAANYGLQEAAQAESTRQYNESLAQSEKQNALSLALQREQLAQAQKQFDTQMSETQKQQAISNAYTELSNFGMIKTAEAAVALGVPIGTTLTSMQVQTASGSKKKKSTDDVTDSDIMKEYMAQLYSALPGVGGTLSKSVRNVTNTNQGLLALLDKLK